MISRARAPVACRADSPQQTPPSRARRVGSQRFNRKPAAVRLPCQRLENRREAIVALPRRAQVPVIELNVGQQPAWPMEIDHLFKRQRFGLAARTRIEHGSQTRLIDVAHHSHSLLNRVDDRGLVNRERLNAVLNPGPRGGRARLSPAFGGQCQRFGM